MTPAGKSPPESRQAADDNLRVVAQIQQQAAERRTLAQRLSDRVSAWASPTRPSSGMSRCSRRGSPSTHGCSRSVPSIRIRSACSRFSSASERCSRSLFVLASQNRLRQEEDHRAHLGLQIQPAVRAGNDPGAADAQGNSASTWNFATRLSRPSSSSSSNTPTWRVGAAGRTHDGR